MPSISRFVLPPRDLASCVVGFLYRDTRGTHLSDADRLNYFPASPFFAASVVLDGALHLSDTLVPLNAVRQTPIVPRTAYAAPKSAPHMSWSPGPIAGLSVVFFPDAWKSLGGTFDATPPPCLPHALEHFDRHDVDAALPLFWEDMARAWAATQRADGAMRWAGSHRIKNWTYHLMKKASQSGKGRSFRSAQRRIRRWTGQDMQTLNFFAQIDELHARVAAEPDALPVDYAADAGFSDQSHMGRALKRATGFSPVQLNQRIAEDEAFWCYRLLGERF